MSKRENPGECDCCGFVTNDLQLFADQDTTLAGGGKTRKDDFWFCDLCCSTMASTSHRYPGHYADHASMRTTCYVGNVLLDALNKRKSK
jgi:hypothetical protein